MKFKFMKVVFTSIITKELCLRKVAHRKGSAECCLKTTNWSMTFFFGLKLAQKIKSQELFCHECMWVIRVNWFAPCGNQTSQLRAH